MLSLADALMIQIDSGCINTLQRHHSIKSNDLAKRASKASFQIEKSCALRKLLTVIRKRITIKLHDAIMV